MPEPGPVLITGAKGQLGGELTRLMQAGPYKQPFLSADRTALDITDHSHVLDYCNENQPSIIINGAAYTAVDKAESEPDAAFEANEKGPANLAAIGRDKDIPLIHISTDFVFDGAKPGMYHEEDTTNPLGVYGKSKLAGEKAVFESHPKTIIIRTGWLYSGRGKNFFLTILNAAREKDTLKVVADQAGTPTHVRNLAEAIIHMLPRLDKGSGQIFHYANEGIASWYDFASAIVRLAGINCNVLPIETAEYPTPAARPMYSVLNKKKIKQTFGLSIPHWIDSLEKCIQEQT